MHLKQFQLAQNWITIQDLIAEKLLIHSQDINHHVCLIPMYINKGNFYLESLETELAISNYIRALNIMKSIKLDNEFFKAAISGNLAIAYSEIKDYTNAFKYIDKSIKIFAQLYGSSHPYLASKFNTLGGIYFKKYHFLQINDSDVTLNRAYFGFKQAYLIMARHFPPNHLALGEVCDNITNILTEKGKYAEALKYNSIAQRIFEYNNSDYELANCLSNRASIFKKIGDIYNTLTCYKEALRKYKKCLASPMDIAGVLYNIGLFYVKLDKKFPDFKLQIVALSYFIDAYIYSYDHEHHFAQIIEKQLDDYLKDYLESKSLQNKFYTQILDYASLGKNYVKAEWGLRKRQTQDEFYHHIKDMENSKNHLSIEAAQITDEGSSTQNINITQENVTNNNRNICEFAAREVERRTKKESSKGM
jgi:tetratricopeptide (TPR) repeat protein